MTEKQRALTGGRPCSQPDGVTAVGVGRRQTVPCTRRRLDAARYDRRGPASRTNSIDRPTSFIILLVFARLAIAEAEVASPNRLAFREHNETYDVHYFVSSVNFIAVQWTRTPWRGRL